MIDDTLVSRYGAPMPRKPQTDEAGHRYAKAHLSFPPAMLAWIDAEARRLGMPRSAIVQMFVAEAMTKRGKSI